MGRLNTELFISRRISSRSSSDKGVMVTIATFSVAIGMAVMIVALAVIGGFKKQITERLVGFGGDVQIIDVRTDTSAESMPITVNDTLMQALAKVSGFRHIAPFAVKNGIIKTSEAIEGVQLKGIGRQYDLSFFANSMVEGSLPVVDDTIRHKDLLISRSTADRMKLGVGDKVEMIFVGGTTPVRRDVFKVSGIYSTGMDDMERYMVLTDIANVQRLNRWNSSQATGYEILSNNFANIDSFTTAIKATVAQTNDSNMTLRTVNIRDLNPGIFDWLKTHNVNAAVVITIMLIVALLNMITAMLIILLERTRMIGILKALGMRNARVRRIFVGHSLAITLRGMLWGDLAGIGLCLVQLYTGWVKLDSTGYMLSEMPVELGWQWLVALNVGVPLIITLLLLVPIAVVSLIKPEQTIRYQ